VDSAGRQARLPVRNAKSQAPLDEVGAYGPRISADGRYVVFTSDADNLVAGDTNGRGDVFRHDRLTGRTVRVSVSITGAQLVGSTSIERFARSMTPDGRLVVFETHATTPGQESCSPACGRVLVWDARTATTTDVTPRPPVGFELDVLNAAIADDGRYVAFVGGITKGRNLTGQISRHIVDKIDVATGEPSVVLQEASSHGSVVTSGTSAGLSFVDLSADGRYIAFDSYESLVAGDSNGAKDVFVRDTLTGITNQLSHTPSGTAWSTDSLAPQLSADGRTVSYLHDTNSGSLAGTNTLAHVFVHHSSVAGAP
jgi:Tol biopolymer transport system component